MIQANTDGVTVKIPRDKQDDYYNVCKQWEKDVGLELEYANYDKMMIRDVNNYIAVYESGGVKRKGAYEYDNLGWHQNQSSLVIPMAVEHELLGLGTIENFIESHANKFDFMLRTKVPRSSRLVMVVDDEDVLQQNICRYYPSKDGGKLVKIMPPLEKKTTRYWKSEDGTKAVSNTETEVKKLVKNGYEELSINFEKAVSDPDFLKLMERRLSIDSDWNVKTCNNILDYDGDIDYDYYISNARKLVDQLKGG